MDARFESGVSAIRRSGYLRGWLRLHAELPRKYTMGMLAAFAGGLLTVRPTLESPVDALGGLLLEAHMIQHSSAFGDQSAAGAIMWVRGSIAFLVPAVMLGTQALTEVPLDAPTRSQRSGASRFSVFQREHRGISCGRRFSGRFSGIVTFDGNSNQRCC